MIKRTITYKSVDGDTTITEDFYFHYSTAEATQMKISFGDDIENKIKQLIAAKNGSEIVRIFQGIIADSIGQKSANGKSFLKSKEMSEEFLGSDAYSELLLWLFADQENMAEFVNGLFPKNLHERVGQLVQDREGRKTLVDLPVEGSPVGGTPNLSIVPQRKFSDYTREELLNMPSDEFAALKARG